MNIYSYVSTGARYFDKPEDMIDCLKNNTPNPLLKKGIFFPSYYDTSTKTLKMLDLLIKEYRPSIVVETGFGNGISAKQILSSFKDYNLTNSKLYSIDVDPIVKSTELLNNSQFNLVIINNSKDFINVINSIEKIDLFYHDSDHSYHNQMFEYNVIWKKLNSKGVLATDDADSTEAFINFCIKVKRNPILLCDHGKYSGAIIK